MTTIFRKRILFLCCFLLSIGCAIIPIAFPDYVSILEAQDYSLQGDLDKNGKVDLKDVILGLQVTAGLRTASTIGYNGTIGLSDAIYDLRVLAGINIGKGRALTPLSGASVNVYRLNNLQTPVYTTMTDADGYFATTQVNNSYFVVVAISGGQYIDANDDGIPGDTVQNNGTLYALMTAEEFAAGNFVVSAITDIAYQYTKNLIGQTDNAWLKTRMDDIAKNFFIADLNGDGVIDSKDLLMFTPKNATHKSKLNFDYQQLFAKDSATSLSIADCYHTGNQGCILSLLNTKFGSRLSLYPAPDNRYQKLKIEVAAFGKGSVKSDVGGIDIDSARSNAADNVKYAFFDQSATGKVVLTATPKTDTQIMSWNGCDTVSSDKTKCESNLRADRLITVSFGYRETKLKDGVTLVDLSNAAVTISSDLITLNVTANTGDTDMIAKLAVLKVGDVVVGSAGSGFLRKVAYIQKISNSNYILTTADVSIEEVIAQGTGEFFKQMTYGDLAGNSTLQRSTRSAAQVSGFEGIEGVRLIPSDNPNERVFKIQIGDPHKRSSMGGELTWQDPKYGTTVTLKGEVEVTIDVEKGASYSLSPVGLEYLKLIMNVTSSNSLDLSVGGKLKVSRDVFTKELGKLQFAPIAFAIGPVPVWLTPEVKISFGGDIEVGGQLTGGIKLQQTARAGVVYNRSIGLESVHEYDPSFDFTTPSLQSYAEVKPYLKVEPGIKIYSVTGPAIEMKGYGKVKGEMNVPFFNDPCSGGIFVSLFGGVEAGFEWDLGSFKKFSKLAEDTDLSITLGEKEVLLKKWHIDGICSNKPPFMEITGLDMSKAVAQGSGQTVSQTYTVKNSGDYPMDWEIRYFEDGKTTVSPKSGTLSKGQSAPITVSVNTSGLGIGIYRNEIEFINKYDSGLYDYLLTSNGSTKRKIAITIDSSTLLASPVMVQPQLAKTSSGSVIPTIVNLSWSYPDSNTAGYVRGYLIYISQDPNNGWQKIATLTTPTNSAQVANLQPNITYYFKMQAYGNNLSGIMSGVVSVKTSSTTITPTIAQTPMSGPSGTTFVQWGTGFTPNTTAVLHFLKPDGTEYPALNQAIDSIGHFETSYTAPSDKPPGTYKWWGIDGATGKKSNEVSYIVEVKPTIAQTPMSGPAGTTFVQWGTGFTPNTTAVLHFLKPDGTEYPTQNQVIDSIGHFETSYTAPSNKPPGTYKWWGIDGATGKKSNEVSYVVEVKPTIAQTPMSGPAGTTFVQWGTGFTPNTTAVLHFRKPDGTEYPTQNQAIDSIGHFETSYTAPSNKPPGTYVWWGIDGATGKKSNEVGYTIY